MTVSKKEIIEKLKELGYKANSKNTITSSLEKGYVMILSNDDYIKVSAEELGYKDYTTYKGYGYHGGGRKKTGIKRVSIAISGTEEQLAKLKQLAKDNGMNTSQFVLTKTGVINDSSRID